MTGVRFADGFDRPDTVALGLGAPQLGVVVLAAALVYLLVNAPGPTGIRIAAAVLVAALGALLGWGRLADRPLLTWGVLLIRYLAAPRSGGISPGPADPVVAAGAGEGRDLSMAENDEFSPPAPLLRQAAFEGGAPPDDVREAAGLGRRPQEEAETACAETEEPPWARWLRAGGARGTAVFEQSEAASPRGDDVAQDDAVGDGRSRAAGPTGPVDGPASEHATDVPSPPDGTVPADAPLPSPAVAPGRLPTSAPDPGSADPRRAGVQLRRAGLRGSRVGAALTSWLGWGLGGRRPSSSDPSTPDKGAARPRDVLPADSASADRVPPPTRRSPHPAVVDLDHVPLMVLPDPPHRPDPTSPGALAPAEGDPGADDVGGDDDLPAGDLEIDDQAAVVVPLPSRPGSVGRVDAEPPVEPPSAPAAAAGPAVLAPPFLGATRRIAFFSLNGGSGRTTLATEVACLLAARGRHRPSPEAPAQRLRVALLDLDLRSSNVAVRLGIPQPTLLDYLLQRGAGAGDPDPSSCLVRHPTGLSVLLGPPKPLAPSAGLDPAVVAEIVCHLEGQGLHFLVVDLGADLGPVTTWVLGQVHDIFVVIRPTASGVQDAYRSTELLRRQGLGPRLRYVVNRARGPVDLDEVMGDLGSRVLATIPDDPRVEAAENAHRSVAVDGVGPAAAAIAQLAATLHPGLAAPPRGRSRLGLGRWRRVG